MNNLHKNKRRQSPQLKCCNSDLIFLFKVSIILSLLISFQALAQNLSCDFNQNGKRIKIVSYFGPTDSDNNFIAPNSSDSSVIAITDVSAETVNVNGQLFEKQIVLAELRNIGEAVLSTGSQSKIESFDIPVFNPLLTVEIAGILPAGELPDDDFVALKQGQTYQVSIKPIMLENEPDVNIQNLTKLMIDGSSAFAAQKFEDNLQNGTSLLVKLKVAENSAGEKAKLLFEFADTRSIGVATKYQLSIASVENITDIEKTMNHTLPTSPFLEQNYPNPFNPKTVIRYSLPVTCHLDLSIYNILGQKVATLVNKKQPAGSYEVEFSAQNLSSGIYLYRIEAGKWQDVKKMILLK